MFSFCIANHPITAMTGTVVEDVQTSIVGTKMRADGPLLITHWGLSDPAVLKLSSYGARHLHDCGYNTKISVNWFGYANENELGRMKRLLPLHEMAVNF
ncbi:MAG: aminoacetone oxidase family FAD-binding enzyme, partial [Prevotella sp.]